MPYFHSSPSMSSSSCHKSSRAAYCGSSGAPSFSAPPSSSPSPQTSKAKTSPSSSTQGIISSESSNSTQPLLAGCAASVGKISNVKPAPSQLGVGHIQKP